MDIFYTWPPVTR
jgi:hypothetical protein